MKVFAVIRSDRRDGQNLAVRAATIDDHRTYIASFGSRVRLGGPFQDENGQNCGSMMVVEAKDEQEVREILKNDPFEIAGLSEHIEIHPFRWLTNKPADMPDH